MSASILAQEPPPGGFEIVVADGMSNDGTREILKRLGDEYSSLQLIDNPERIVSSALNEAIKAARETSLSAWMLTPSMRPSMFENV